MVKGRQTRGVPVALGDGCQEGTAWVNPVSHSVPNFPFGPPPADTLHNLTDEQRLQGCCRRIADAVSRAGDGLDCDDPRRVNWWYIYDQLCKAQLEVCRAVQIVEDHRNDADPDSIEADEMNRGDDADPFLPDRADLGGEGGVA